MRSKIIVLTVLVLLVSGIGTASVLSNSGGSEWKYYKEITVKENSGRILTEFQVLVELNSANFDFSKAKSDGSDIRFSTDGEELNYWIEEWDAGAKRAKIWVKVPLIPANGETKIKMCYGNPSAGAVSDGDKVFELFEDFTTDPNWTKVGEHLAWKGAPECCIGGDFVRVINNIGDAYYKDLPMSFTNEDGFACEFDFVITNFKDITDAHFGFGQWPITNLYDWQSVVALRPYGQDHRFRIELIGDHYYPDYTKYGNFTIIEPTFRTLKL